MSIISHNNPIDYAVPISDQLLIDDTLELTEKKVKELVQEWYDAAKEPISTSGKIIVLKKISLLNETLKNAKEKSYEWGNKVANLINKNINEHRKEESDQLAVWIGQNTGSSAWINDSQGQKVCVHGAFDFFEMLFHSTIYDFSTTHESSKIFEEILCKALVANKRDPFLLGDKLFEILSKLPLKDLLEFQKSSKEGYEYASSELARCLNNDIKLTDIVTIDEDCVKKIKFFLSDNCSRIFKLNLQGKTPTNLIKVDFHALDKLNLRFTKLFKNLKDISFQYYHDIDFSLLESCEAVENLSLLTCEFKNFDSKKFSHLKKLNFQSCANESFSIFDPCPTIVSAKLSYCGIQNLNYLKYLPNLKEFSITKLPKLTNEELDFFEFCPNLKDLALILCNELTDFSFFRHLTKLETLSLTSAKQLTQTELIKITEFCPQLKTIRLMGCTLISDQLVKLLRKQGIKILSSKGRWE